MRQMSLRKTKRERSEKSEAWGSRQGRRSPPGLAGRSRPCRPPPGRGHGSTASSRAPSPGAVCLALREAAGVSRQGGWGLASCPSAPCMAEELGGPDRLRDYAAWVWERKSGLHGCGPRGSAWSLSSDQVTCRQPASPHPATRALCSARLSPRHPHPFLPLVFHLEVNKATCPHRPLLRQGSGADDEPGVREPPAPGWPLSCFLLWVQRVCLPCPGGVPAVSVASLRTVAARGDGALRGRTGGEPAGRPA